jgi:hypothetical protein
MAALPEGLTPLLNNLTSSQQRTAIATFEDMDVPSFSQRLEEALKVTSSKLDSVIEVGNNLVQRIMKDGDEASSRRKESSQKVNPHPTIEDVASVGKSSLGFLLLNDTLLSLGEILGGIKLPTIEPTKTPTPLFGGKTPVEEKKEISTGKKHKVPDSVKHATASIALGAGFLALQNILPKIIGEEELNAENILERIWGIITENVDSGTLLTGAIGGVLGSAFGLRGAVVGTVLASSLEILASKSPFMQDLIGTKEITASSVLKDIWDIVTSTSVGASAVLGVTIGSKYGLRGAIVGGAIASAADLLGSGLLEKLVTGDSEDTTTWDTVVEPIKLHLSQTLVLTALANAAGKIPGLSALKITSLPTAIALAITAGSALSAGKSFAGILNILIGGSTALQDDDTTEEAARLIKKEMIASTTSLALGVGVGVLGGKLGAAAGALLTPILGPFGPFVGAMLGFVIGSYLPKLLGNIYEAYTKSAISKTDLSIPTVSRNAEDYTEEGRLAKQRWKQSFSDRYYSIYHDDGDVTIKSKKDDQVVMGGKKPLAEMQRLWDLVATHEGYKGAPLPLRLGETWPESTVLPSDITTGPPPLGAPFPVSTVLPSPAGSRPPVSLVQDGIFELRDSKERGELFSGVKFDDADNLYLMASTNPAKDALSQSIDRLNNLMEKLAESIDSYKPQTNNLVASIPNNSIMTQLLA